MKDLNTYYLKLIALSPVHIGTSESYEPTNFVIDDGYLYEFDEVLFYKSLSSEDKIALENKTNDWLQIIEFYKTKKEEAKKISYFTCRVSKEVEKKYNARNPNQLQINKTFKNPNSHRVIIPGSGIKGMLDTVFGIFPPKSSNEERQKLIVSDALVLDGGVEIGYSYRKHRYKKEEGKGIPQMVEIVKPNSTFVLTINTNKTFTQMQSLMKRYYEERKNSLYKENSMSFISRIGKYCGKEYMVDSAKNITNTYGKPLATHSLYFSDKLQNEMFGWVKFEHISREDFQKSLDDIAKQEQEYYKQKERKQSEIIKAIKVIEDKIKAQKEAIQKAKREVEEKEAQEKAKREETLAKMSPIDRLLDSYSDLAILINDMESNKIENFDEIKKELAKKVKEELQKNPKTWGKAKQKALKRKEYIEELLRIYV